jgi:hypothetical protein
MFHINRIVRSVSGVFCSDDSLAEMPGAIRLECDVRDCSPSGPKTKPVNEVNP